MYVVDVKAEKKALLAAYERAMTCKEAREAISQVKWAHSGYWDKAVIVALVAELERVNGRLDDAIDSMGRW